jgi:hypothetical protein
LSTPKKADVKEFKAESEAPLKITPKRTEIVKSKSEIEKSAKVEAEKAQIDLPEKITKTPSEEAKVSKTKPEEKKSSMVRIASRTFADPQTEKPKTKATPTIEHTQPVTVPPISISGTASTTTNSSNAAKKPIVTDSLTSISARRANRLTRASGVNTPLKESKPEASSKESASSAYLSKAPVSDREKKPAATTTVKKESIFSSFSKK